MSGALERDRSNVVEKCSEEIVCWSRMQAESGQSLQDIIARKERERKAGKGVFFWGVGNAPSTLTRSYVKTRQPIAAVFSTMKSKPKKVDTDPGAISVWNMYFDHEGVERSLPSHALITSKAFTSTGPKKRHYALMCFSNKPLRLSSGVSFDPKAYRNCGVNEGKIGPSQVTALVKKKFEIGSSQYEANLTAHLTGSYWVKLSRPTLLNDEARGIVEAGPKSTQSWVNFVSGIRKTVTLDAFSEPEKLLLI